MEAHAIEHGFKPVTGVTGKLEYLVLGETPGQKKVDKAKELGVPILQTHEYLEQFK